MDSIITGNREITITSTKSVKLMEMMLILIKNLDLVTIITILIAIIMIPTSSSLALRRITVYKQILIIGQIPMISTQQTQFINKNKMAEPINRTTGAKTTGSQSGASINGTPLNENYII